MRSKENMTEPVNQIHTAEEEAANRAAAELQERKKRKKHVRRILFVLILVLIGIGIYGYYRYQEYQTALAEAKADVLALADGEELTYGEITEVVGNDITVAVVEEGTSPSSDDANAKTSEDAPVPGGSSDNISASAAPGGPSVPQQTSYTETGETKEYEIPVGTAVTSALGSTTTFAKLKSGNIIGIVTEAGTDNILRIKIVQ